MEIFFIDYLHDANKFKTPYPGETVSSQIREQRAHKEETGRGEFESMSAPTGHSFPGRKNEKNPEVCSTRTEVNQKRLGGGDANKHNY